MATEYKTRVQTLIDDVVEASKVPAKKRSVEVKLKVAELTSVAYNQGVLPEELIQLIDLLTAPSCLDQASLNSIIRNLYPVGKVPEDVILKIVGSLGVGELRPALTLQSSLLQWIMLVYHVLDTKAQAILSRAYSVLFNLLDVSATRPQLFHLLAIITRRVHVQHYRIQALLNLSRQTGGNDRHLQGLLRVYRNYYPEIIVGNTGKGSAFKLPDPEWKERLSVIQKMHREQQSSVQGPRDGFKTSQQLLHGSRGVKALIPPVQTSNAHEKSVTLEEIDSAESLASNLEKVELPDHLVAVLVDPLLQKFMMLRPDQNLKRALAWMDAQIGEILNGDADDEAVENTLRVIYEFARSTKDISPFFPGLVRLIERRRLRPDSRIYDILAYAPIMDPKDLNIFTSILESTLDGSAASQLDLLTLYTNFVHRWNITLLSEADTPQHASVCIAWLVTHVNQLSLTLLQTSPTESTALKVLDFYERLAYLYSNPTLLRVLQITIPPVPLVYTLQFSLSLTTVSRLCTVLACYKRAFAVYMSNAAKKLGPQYDKAQVNTFNGFLMDICNCLWRGKAFAKSDAHAKGCMISDTVISSLERYVANLSEGGDMTLPTLFTMSYSPLVCLQAIEHVRRREENEDEEVELQARHAGPVTQKSLALLARRGGLEMQWQDYRLGVLKHLNEREWKGVPELMYSTMRNLLDARARS
ncbi:Centromere protein I [Cytospora mali]|uniref:Centromere protein I n=1 Tax=Cytospora mali TaxID=578113 RepID=A0A194W4S4_CYTMA|nr:Centromere protein I [Valsa mali]